ncbi:heterokaryon incompatibility het [Trichoderma arundinaceum]|uniref:Heterokaryon incompatibility het n=1 Tax=Trichoderma arundinaceum TaxID=490622 RepID=A0A395P028_TRIAR|nr:heterokaryon incompatibility het [Trichoderma arundinaceum]
MTSVVSHKIQRTMQKQRTIVRNLRRDSAWKTSFGPSETMDGAEYGKDTTVGEENPFIDFGNVLKTRLPGRTRDDKWHAHEQTAVSFEYKREDILPDLPGLLSTSSRGCAFCDILRKDIVCAWESPTGRSKFDHNDRKANITFTDVKYMLQEFGHQFQPRDESDPKACLNTLGVFFTVQWDDTTRYCMLYYNVHAEPSDPCASWFHIRRKPVFNEFSSPITQDRIGELIAKSLVHDFASASGPFLPKRLLDVESPSSSAHIQLVITNQYEPLLTAANADSKRYAALSYCWGSEQEAAKQLKTTRATIDEHLLRINVNKLPQTVADAVQVCRDLHIRYLWVDALCIIQGDDDDWSEESFNMSKVYSNNFITICILQGNSCASGFLKKAHSPRTLQVNFQSKLNASVSGKLYLQMIQKPDEILQVCEEPESTFIALDSEYYEPDIMDSALNKRGWTFQEGELSPRKLLFGNTSTYIICGELRESAQGLPFDDRSFFQLANITSADASIDAFDDWYTLVQLYARRELSYVQDTLPAISAFARTTSERLSDQMYLAGLWRADLTRGLFWIGDPKQTDNHIDSHSIHYTAPSWSWACYLNNVEWLGGNANSSYTFSPEFMLQKADIDTNKLNPFGLVYGGYIQIHGKLFQILLEGKDRPGMRIEDKGEQRLGKEFEILQTDNNEYVSHIHLDWRTRKRQDQYAKGLYMALIASIKLTEGNMRYFKHVNDSKVMMGLLLLPTGNMNEFIRAGVWYSESIGLGGRMFWDDIQPKSFKIV